MKVELLKVNISKATKTDKNGKRYKTCGIESDGLQYVYFYNIYDQRDPVLTWKPGDTVDIETVDNGEWHNFKPITAYKPSTQAQTTAKSAPVATKAPQDDLGAILTKTRAELAALKTRVEGIEGMLNDLKNDGTLAE